MFMVLLAPRQRSIGRQLVFMTIAGLCAVLAVATKVFAFVPLLAVPLLVLVLMDPKPETSRPEQSPLSARTLAIVLIVGTLTILPAAAMVAHALSQSGNTFFRYAPLAFGLFGLYQAGFALLVLGAIAIYARIRKVPLVTALAATVALGIGVALGVLALGIKYDPRNVTAVLYPIEHLFEFSRWSNPDLIKRGKRRQREPAGQARCRHRRRAEATRLSDPHADQHGDAGMADPRRHGAGPARRRPPLDLAGRPACAGRLGHSVPV